jgi:hypothetical protein
MPIGFLAPIRSADRAVGGLHGALTDPAGAERAVVLALAVYAVLWTIYGAIANSVQGLHPDMTELIDRSRHPA